MATQTEKPVTEKDIDAVRERVYEWSLARSYDVDGEHVMADQILDKWQAVCPPFKGDPWECFLNWIAQSKMEIRAGTRVRIGRTIPVGGGQLAHYEFELVAENRAMRDVAAAIINRWIDDLVAHTTPISNAPIAAARVGDATIERVTSISVLTDGKGGRLYKVKTTTNPRWGVPLYSDSQPFSIPKQKVWLEGLAFGEHNVTGTLLAAVQYKGEKPARVINLTTKADTDAIS